MANQEILAYAAVVVLCVQVVAVVCSSETWPSNECHCSHAGEYLSGALGGEANGTQKGHYEIGKCSCPEHGCIPGDYTEFYALEVDYTDHAVIINKCGQSFPNLLYLNVSGFQYVVPGSFEGHPKLTHLRLLNDFMHVINKGVFGGLEDLNMLHADGCGIYDVKEGAFLGLPKMETLTLSNNSVWNIAAGAFAGLGSLLEMDLSYNNILKLKTGRFADMTRLQTLKLSSNDIAHIERGAFKGLDHIQMIDLTYNHLQVLPNPSFFSGRTLNMRDLINVDLRGNPLRCDCRMNWINALIDQAAFSIHGVCAYPSEVSRQTLKRVYSKHLSQCKPNGTEVRIIAGTNGNLPCPIPDASWLIPNDNETILSEPGQRWNEYVLSNGDSLVIFDVQKEKHSGTYKCYSADGEEQLYYHMSVPKQPFRLTRTEWIVIGAGAGAGAFILMVCGALYWARKRHPKYAEPLDVRDHLDNPPSHVDQVSLHPSLLIPSASGTSGHTSNESYSNKFFPSSSADDALMKRSSGSSKFHKYLRLSDSDYSDSGDKINHGLSM